ncbi:hypothetical protein AVEN_231336-1 [Araneus ventricosus]|uniref:Uncharacterized protein n=1 Tax=Araneus ventricosus TaxID=182803 RepID=A0A4Y2CKR0_ARAVE|nr:hypothetical protein AVEN_231336-1 [Araneus ventricosus]
MDSFPGPGARCPVIKKKKLLGNLCKTPISSYLAGIGYDCNRLASGTEDSKLARQRAHQTVEQDRYGNRMARQVRKRGHSLPKVALVRKSFVLSEIHNKSILALFYVSFVIDSHGQSSTMRRMLY